jgi:hypothetical protein
VWAGRAVLAAEQAGEEKEVLAVLARVAVLTRTAMAKRSAQPAAVPELPANPAPGGPEVHRALRAEQAR